MKGGILIVSSQDGIGHRSYCSVHVHTVVKLISGVSGMGSTFFAQTRKNDTKAGGQLSNDRSTLGIAFDVRGSGTEGGCVVHRKAAK